MMSCSAWHNLCPHGAKAGLEGDQTDTVHAACNNSCHALIRHMLTCMLFTVG